MDHSRAGLSPPLWCVVRLPAFWGDAVFQTQPTWDLPGPGHSLDTGPQASPSSPSSGGIRPDTEHLRPTLFLELAPQNQQPSLTRTF